MKVSDQTGLPVHSTARRRDARTRLSAALTVCALWLGEPGIAQDRPQALERFSQVRKALETAWIEFTYESVGDPDGDVVTYSAGLAGPDALMINWGNRHGVVGGNPRRVGRPHSTLKTPAHTWAHDDDGIFVMMSETGPLAGEDVFGMRALGATCYLAAEDIDAALSRVAQPAACRFSESMRDGYCAVEAQTDNGTVTWWIDPERGWSPIRVTYARDGEVLREARVSLSQFDGVWFPDTVAFLRNGALVETIHVTYAKFNRPEHPRRFTPADIGVEPGFIVEKLDAQPGSEMLIWDGEKPVTLTEFGERERAGEIQRGPTNRAALDALPDAAPGLPQSAPDPAPAAGADTQCRQAATGGGPVPARVTELLSQWEQYTRDFIRKYKLDEQQSRRAWWMLRRCQGQANQYLSRKRSEIQQAEREVAHLRDGGAARNDEELVKSSQLLAILLKPLDDVFEQRLKPGLDRIPTREQRRQAETDAGATGGGPSTRPSASDKR